MRKRLSNTLAALIITAIGVLLILNATGVYKFPLFPGWWTLFLIVPSLIFMLRAGINPGNMICLAAGVLLLLNANGLLNGVNIWILLLGLIVVFVGLGMLFRRPKKGPKAAPSMPENGVPTYTAVFSGIKAKNESEDYRGSYITSVFGSAEVDLSGVKVTDKAATNPVAVFASIEIIVPRGFNITTSGVPFFGDIDNDAEAAIDQEQPTLHFNCTSVFGSIHISYGD